MVQSAKTFKCFHTPIIWDIKWRPSFRMFYRIYLFPCLVQKVLHLELAIRMMLHETLAELNVTVLLPSFMIVPLSGIVTVTPELSIISTVGSSCTVPPETEFMVMEPVPLKTTNLVSVISRSTVAGAVITYTPLGFLNPTF